MALSTDLGTAETEEQAARVVEALRAEWGDHEFAFELEGERFAVFVAGVPVFPLRSQMVSKAREVLHAAAAE